MLALKERDNQAFNFLYDNYAGALYSIIKQIITDNAELASDVLQEVFINIWRKIETYDQTKGRLFTWMLNIARNASIDTLRSKSYQNSQKNQELPDNVYKSVASQITQMNVDNIGLKKVLEKFILKFSVVGSKMCNWSIRIARSKFQVPELMRQTIK